MLRPTKKGFSETHILKIGSNRDFVSVNGNRIFSCVFKWLPLPYIFVHIPNNNVWYLKLIIIWTFYLLLIIIPYHIYRYTILCNIIFFNTPQKKPFIIITTTGRIRLSTCARAYYYYMIPSYNNDYKI